MSVYKPGLGMDLKVEPIKVKVFVSELPGSVQG